MMAQKENVTEAERLGNDGRKALCDKPRSLPIAEWSESDQLGWAEACRPAQRLKRGGVACHLAPVSRKDFANRYGLYLNFLQRNGGFDPAGNAALFVSPTNVQEFIAELQARVRSVTVWNSVYKLRRAAQLIAPASDFGWLSEIEKDLALVMVPRAKFSRLILTERLVKAGLALIQEAETFGKTPVSRAKGVRNGLLIVLLALHPIRIKNFAALALADTFVCVGGRWWLHIPAENTKSRRMDERQVPKFVTDVVNRYIDVHRPVLRRGFEHPALYNGQGNDDQEPSNANLEAHSRNVGCGCLAAFVSDRGCFDRRYLRRQPSASC